VTDSIAENRPSVSAAKLAVQAASLFELRTSRRKYAERHRRRDKLSLGVRDVDAGHTRRRDAHGDHRRRHSAGEIELDSCVGARSAAAGGRRRGVSRRRSSIQRRRLGRRREATGLR